MEQEKIMKREEPALKMLSLQDIVVKLETLMKMALDAEQKPIKEDVSFKDVYKRLLEVQKAITFLAKDQKDLLQLMTSATGVSIDTNSASLKPENARLYAKLSEMEKKCEEAQNRVHTAIQKQEGAKEFIQEQLMVQSKDPKSIIIHRRNKFKKMGSEEGWLKT